MKVIGLCGPKQSGKDTTLGFLKELFPSIIHVSLANKLKDVCSDVFDISRVVFDDQSLKEVPFSYFGRKVTFDGFRMAQILTRFGLEEKIIFEETKIDRFMEKNSDLVFNSARHIAQFIGTEVLREFGNPEIHCQKLMQKMEENPEALFCITDVRFINEIEYFKCLLQDNFFSIYIERPSVEKNITPSSHVSEKETLSLKELALTKLDNSGTIEGLGKRIQCLELRIKRMLSLGV